MVLAAALISLAALGPTAEPQSGPPDDPKPYTVEGVRRASAAAAGPQPHIDTVAVERGRQGYRMALESRSVTPDPCGFVVTGCRPNWELPPNPTWHDEFLAMAGPQGYAIPYSAMNNSQRLQAVATNLAFGLAIQAITTAIQQQVVKSSRSRQQRKVEAVRTEIQAELAELERLNAAAKK